MTQKSDQLIKRLRQMTEGILDYEMPESEKMRVKSIIHESVQDLKDEQANMSKEDKANTILQLTLLVSIIRSSLKEQGILL